MDKITNGPRFEITLSEQEIELLNPGQKAMAKDWHLVNKKLDWIITKTIEHNNALVDHDGILDTHRTFIKIFKYVIPVSSGIFILVMGFVKLVKFLWGTKP